MVNVKSENRLVNALASEVMEFKAVNNKIKTISVKSEGKLERRTAMKYNRLTLEHYWILIAKFQASFGIKK